jgi:hypothetical protein
MVEAAVVVTVESLVVAKAAAKIVEGTGSITMVIVDGTWLQHDGHSYAVRTSNHERDEPVR